MAGSPGGRPRPHVRPDGVRVLLGQLELVDRVGDRVERIGDVEGLGIDPEEVVGARGRSSASRRRSSP